MGGAYTVRRWGVLAAQGALLVALVAWTVTRGPVPWIFWATVLFGALALWPASLVLRVDSKGVRLGRATSVPWSSIREVVVFSPGVVAADPALGLRLRPEAPLPGGMKSIIHDPRQPDEIPEALQKPVHNLELAWAVGRYGGVPLISVGESTEHEISQ